MSIIVVYTIIMWSNFKFTKYISKSGHLSCNTLLEQRLMNNFFVFDKILLIKTIFIFTPQKHIPLLNLIDKFCAIDILWKEKFFTWSQMYLCRLQYWIHFFFVEVNFIWYSVMSFSQILFCIQLWFACLITSSIFYLYCLA